MFTYPLRINVPPYGGKNQSKLAEYQGKVRLARMIEEYVDERMKDQAFGTFNYYQIAQDLGDEKENVAAVLRPIELSSNEITVCNPNFPTSQPPQ